MLAFQAKTNKVLCAVFFCSAYFLSESAGYAQKDMDDFVTIEKTLTALGGRVNHTVIGGTRNIISSDLQRASLEEIHFEMLGRLTKLEELVLSDTRTADPWLKHLHNLKQLKVLSLRNTKVTDNGLDFLTPLTGLRQLDVGYTAVTSEGISRLDARASLKELYMTKCNLGDKALRQVARSCPSLTTLGLMVTNVSDDDIADLAILKKLSFLYLDRTKVTKTGVDALLRQRPLRVVDVDQTKITNEDAAALRELYPKTKIRLSPARNRPKRETPR